MPDAATPGDGWATGEGLSAGRGVVLVGLPGSGKSTVGRLVAERLGRSFVDSDELIAKRVGVPAAEYLRTKGEPAFREVERDALHEATADPDAVIAPGAGALGDPLSRWALWAHGRAIHLDAHMDVLLRRLAQSRTPRPLLEGSPDERLAELAADRAPLYRAADAAVDASRAASDVADEVIRALDAPPPDGRRLFDSEVPRHHPIGPLTARIVIGPGLGTGPICGVFDAVGGSPRLVADGAAMSGEHAAAIAALIPEERRLLVEGGESIKTMRALEAVLRWLASTRAERGDPLVAIGGGSVLDAAGLAAALHARGAPWIAVPTTWLAQVDAAYGGKVAVDLPEAKNGVGAFWPPVAVITDAGRLATLPPEARRDGMAEAIKAALIGDPRLWELIATRGRAALDGTDEAARYAITERAVRVKLAIVRRDPFEDGERRQLNLGHTLGHALEVASGYRLPHGAAVALGLRAVTTIARGRGADAAVSRKLDDVLTDLGFALTADCEPEAVRDALSTDKKRVGGRQRWLLPMTVGSVVEVDDVTARELDRAIESVNGRA